jgi:RimJ/RimL family protein N-acetyltransferase
MTKRHIHPVENDLVILHLLHEEDLPRTLAWRNQDEIRRWFLTTDVIEMEMHRAWYDRYQTLDNDFVFVILSKELGNLPVGQISLYAIDWEARVGEYGRLMMGEPLAKGRGLAKSASQLLLGIGFGVLGLERIVLEVKNDNIAAISLYQRLGFVQIDVQTDLILMEIKSLGFLGEQENSVEK